MSKWVLALVRDLVPVIGVIALALFVLWQGAERRQRESEGDRGRASHVQSPAESGDGVPWRLAEPSEPHRTERPAVAPELALPAGVGISALAAVVFVAYPSVRRRARGERS